MTGDNMKPEDDEVQFIGQASKDKKSRDFENTHSAQFHSPGFKKGTETL